MRQENQGGPFFPWGTDTVGVEHSSDPMTDRMFNVQMQGPFIGFGSHLGDAIAYARAHDLMGAPSGEVTFRYLDAQVVFHGKFSAQVLTADGQRSGRVATATDFGGAPFGEALAARGVDLTEDYPLAGPWVLRTHPVDYHPGGGGPTGPPVTPPPEKESFLLYHEYENIVGSHPGRYRIHAEPGTQYPKTTRNLGMDKWSPEWKRWDPVKGFTFDVFDSDIETGDDALMRYKAFEDSVRSDIGGVIDARKLWDATQALLAVRRGNPSGI